MSRLAAQKMFFNSKYVSTGSRADVKLALIRRQFAATGGAELYTQRLLAALAGAGHEVHLFAESWSEVPADVQFSRVTLTGGRHQRPARFAQAVKGLLAESRFDCVFSLERTLQQHVYRAGDGVHGVWLERRRRFAPAWKRVFIGRSAFHRNILALEKQTLDPRNTGRVIVNSEMVRQEILKYFSFPTDRIHLVRNGIEVRRFQGIDRTAARKQFGLSPDDYVLLFVGSGWERKGLKYLFQAAKRIQSESKQERTNLKLLVVGKGRKPGSVPSNTIFTGPLSNVAAAYAAADLFVFLPIYEPSANVVVEALVAGLPVVTTIYNGASELIEDGVNGTVVNDPADTEQVAQAIQHWRAKRFYAPPLRAAGFSIDRNVAETIAVLELAAREKAQ